MEQEETTLQRLWSRARGDRDLIRFLAPYVVLVWLLSFLLQRLAGFEEWVAWLVSFFVIFGAASVVIGILAIRDLFRDLDVLREEVRELRLELRTHPREEE